METGKAEPKPTAEQWAELAMLGALPEAEIDTQDIPEQRDWSGAKRGLLYRQTQHRSPRR